MARYIFLGFIAAGCLAMVFNQVYSEHILRMFDRATGKRIPRPANTALRIVGSLVALFIAGVAIAWMIMPLPNQR